MGALSVVCASKAVAQRVEGQLKLVIRPMYSNPPRHGAEIAARVLGARACVFCLSCLRFCAFVTVFSEDRGPVDLPCHNNITRRRPGAV